MARLVIVSNRVAVPNSKEIRAGGLEVALNDALAQRGGIWLGWSGEVKSAPDDRPAAMRQGGVTYLTLDISRDDYEAFYLGFSNRSLWPLCHFHTGLVSYKRSDEAAYLQVNQRYAGALARVLEPDDIVWVHDYHFIPLGRALRALGVDNRIGYFHHIPVPPPEVTEILPGHARLLEALLDFDLVGVQTNRDLVALAGCFERLLGATRDGDVIASGTRRTRIGSFPIGVDVERIQGLAARSGRNQATRRLVDSLRGRALGIGVDRLDYSKGLVERLEAIRHFLAARFDLRRAVTFLQITPISRGEVEEYQHVRQELDLLASRINGEFAEFDSIPLRYVNKAFPQKVLAGFYRTARLCLVTPTRDGMNLVAKEFVAAQDPRDPGVLVLSRFAGAAEAMTEALLVNPYDAEEMAEAIGRGFDMPLAERRERWEALIDAVRKTDIAIWRESFLAKLSA